MSVMYLQPHYPMSLIDRRYSQGMSELNPSWVGFSTGSSPSNSSRRPSTDIADSLYKLHVKQRKRSLSSSGDNPDQPSRKNSLPNPEGFFVDCFSNSSIPPPRTSSALTSDQAGGRWAARRDSGGATSQSDEAKSSSSSGGERGRPFPKRSSPGSEIPLVEGQDLQKFSFPPRQSHNGDAWKMANPQSTYPSTHAESPSGGASDDARAGGLYGRFLVPSAIAEEVTAFTNPRGRRRLSAPGLSKYPNAPHLERRMEESRSNMIMRDLPALSTSRTSSPIPPDAPQRSRSEEPDFMSRKGKWRVPAAPPSRPISKSHQRAQMMAMAETKNGRRLLRRQYEDLLFGMEQLDQLTGSTPHPDEAKAMRGGYNGLGLAKDETWKLQPDFQDLLEAPGVERTRTEPTPASKSKRGKSAPLPIQYGRARSSSLYIEQPDSPPPSPPQSPDRSTKPTKSVPLTGIKKSASKSVLHLVKKSSSSVVGRNTTGFVDAIRRPSIPFISFSDSPSPSGSGIGGIGESHSTTSGIDWTRLPGQHHEPTTGRTLITNPPPIQSTSLVASGSGSRATSQDLPTSIRSTSPLQPNSTTNTTNQQSRRRMTIKTVVQSFRPSNR